tara:strand:- start:171 stop:500 length:330 start_codon:yes stop_codon:yes gene_type:complete
MKKIILCLLLATFSNVIFASFPVNDIANQKEIVLESKRVGHIIGIVVFVSTIISYPFFIMRHLSKPIPKDVNKKKKFYRNLLFIIFIPPLLALLIYALLYAYAISNISF